MSEPSEELMEVAFFALDHAVSSVSEGGPLVPFLLTAKGEERDLQRFVADTLEESLEEARDAANGLGQEVGAYAIGHDGYVTVEGEKFDALFIEAAERSDPEAVVLAQRYRPKKGLKKFKAIGNPASVARPESRF